MKYLVCLMVVAVALVAFGTVDGKRKKKGRGTQSRDDHGDHMKHLQEQMDELSARLDTMGSGGGGDESCPAEKVHLHFHNADVSADDVDADGTHVHIELSHKKHGDSESGSEDEDDDHHGCHHCNDTHGHRELSAHCEMVPVGESDVTGYVHITQEHHETANFMVTMHYLDDLDADHMLHVHKYGGLSNGCDDIGGHYNPYHDGTDVGDLGTLWSDSDGEMDMLMINGTALSLVGKYSIIGHAIAVHGPDHATIACCSIGWSAAMAGQTGGGQAHGGHTMKHSAHAKKHHMPRRSLADALNLL